MGDLVPGTVIAGRYRLERPLGEGGMGEVWAATHEITGGRVALKFLKASVDARSGTDARRRFLREARASTLVDHPNVVPVRDVVDHEDTPVLVMDLLTGETLAERLARLGSFDLGDAARIGIQVVAAVGAAHEAGVIHRDLKPENVFLSRSNAGEVVRVLDFGIAKLMRVDPSDFGGGGVTQSGTLVGTPAYMAPEQVFGERNLDHRVDIWAIGVILHEALTGYRPIEGENYGQIAKKLLSGPIVTIATRRPDLPEDVIALVDGMLARERNDRISDLRKVVDVLARYSTAARPSFGPPRMSLESNPSGKLVVSEDAIAATRRAHDVSADTLIAGSEPERRSNTPSRLIATTATPEPLTTKPPARVPVPFIASGILLVAALGVGAGVFLSNRAPAAGGTTPMASATPLVAPTPLPIVTASATVTATPTATATTTATEPLPTPSVPVTASAKPNHSPTGVTTIKTPPSVKSAPTASASAAPTVPPTAPTPTNTGGLVTKPPF